MSLLSKENIAAQERQRQEQDYEIWKQMQARSGALGSGGFGLSRMAAEEGIQAAPEAREVHQATKDLDFALQRLSEAVVQLNHRTSDVQRSDAETSADCGQQRALPSAPVAQVIAKAAIMILDQVEKLEAMDRRIQL